MDILSSLTGMKVSWSVGLCAILYTGWISHCIVGAWDNVALGKPANQSSTGWEGYAWKAVDGNSNPDFNHGILT